MLRPTFGGCHCVFLFTCPTMSQNQALNHRNVLIAVDGSEHSERAFKYALCSDSDQVVVFHAEEIANLASGSSPYGFANFDHFQEMLNRADEDAKALLRHYGDTLKTKPNIKFKLIKEDGKPGELICNICRDKNIELVVMGSRGLGIVRRTFLGSVSDYVIHHCHLPVCVVPPKDRHC